MSHQDPRYTEQPKSNVGRRLVVAPSKDHVIRELSTLLVKIS